MKELYLSIWKNFSRNIKLGINEDISNREKLAELLLFPSSNSNDLTTLRAYIERMKPDQKEIYYFGGENVDVIKISPLV